MQILDSFAFHFRMQKKATRSQKKKQQKKATRSQKSKSRPKETRKKEAKEPERRKKANSDSKFLSILASGHHARAADATTTLDSLFHLM